MADIPKTSENTNKTEEKAKVDTVKTDTTKTDIPKTPTDKVVDGKEPPKTPEAPKTPTDKAVDKKEADKTAEAPKVPTDKAADKKENDKTPEVPKTPIDKAADKKETDKTAEAPKAPTDKAVDGKESPKTPEAPKIPTDKAVDKKETEKPPETPKAPTDKAADKKETDKTPEAPKIPTDKTAGNKETDKTPEAPKAPTDKAAKAKVIDFTSTVKDKATETAAKAADVKIPTKEAETVPPEPKEVPRKGEKEEIVLLNPNDLHAFKNHPFQVRDDDEMRAMVESVKDKGITQPLIVRPLEDGGYEIISGHRRQKASELAGYAEIPCIVRNLTDDEAVTQMVEDNITQRENILPSERAKALQMQLEAIKHQGAKTSGQLGPKENGLRSNEIVAERNKMTSTQVKRYIRLNDLVPDLLKLVDTKGLAFTPAVELSYVKPKNQNYIASAIDAEQAAPSLSQTQRMRELDQKGLLNPDIIDGIMLEDKKKEADKVIFTSKELSKFFGEDKTPQEMKAKMMEVMNEWKEKQPPEIGKADKNKNQPEK